MSIHLMKSNFIMHVFDTSQKMVSLADSKASLLIAVQSLIFSIGLGSTLVSKTLEFVPNLKSIFYWLFISLCVVLIISTIIGILLSLSVFYDRKRKPRRNKRSIFNFGKIEKRIISKWKKKVEGDPYLLEGIGNLYFKHILVKFPKVNKYLDYELANYTEPDKDLIKEYLLQIHSISKTLVVKFRLVNLSIVFLVLNLVLSVLLMATDGVILLLN